MADEISIGSKAIKEVQELRAELIKLSQDALQAGKSISSISTPGALNKSQGDNAKAGAELESFKTKYISVTDTVVKQAEKTRLAEIRLQQQRERAFDSFERNAKKEQATLEKQNSVYNRTQQQINNLTKAYNDLSVRKERYNNLSANEEMRLKTLQAVAEKYNGVLKNTDAQIGKNQRNVGNYASGYNALGNSINQLTREAPAFANSLQTGFMAISNNFAALQDAVSGIVEQNRILRAEGKPTESVFKQLGASLFSFQTLLSVGVTLLTIYGADIVKWAGSLMTGVKAGDALKESIKQLSEARIEGSKSAQQELADLTVNLGVAKNLKISYQERLIAVDNLQKQYPEYLGNLSKEQILAGDTAVAENALRDAILSRAKASAATGKITENQAEIIELEEKRVNVLKRVDTAQRNYNNRLKIYNETKDPGVNTALAQSEAELSRSKSSLLSIDNEIAKITEVNNRLTSYAIENASKSVKLNKEEEKATKKKKEAKREDTEALESYLKAQGTTIEQIDKYIDYLRTQMILSTGNAEETQKLTKALKEAEEARKALFGIPVADNGIINNISKTTEAVKELSEETKQYLKSFIDEFASNSGFSETFKILNKEIEDFGENFAVTFNAIAESAQEAFNFISNASQQNFEAEKNRLQTQYDIAFKYANGSKEAEEKLADDLEKKKKDIANREAKAKKQQAIFNIAVDTAQAVVAALPNFVLAGIVAAFGLAQAAVVSAQEIPQYWMGGTHDGGLMMVNDGKGSNYRETIVYPDGKIMQPTGRNVIMDAPAGTEIFTHNQWQNTLSDMLKGKGIDMYMPQYNNSGISKSDMRDVLMETIGSQPQSLINLDENGITQSFINKGNKTTAYTKRGNSTKLRF